MSTSPVTPQDIGQRGGTRTLEKYGVDHFKRISKLAAQARKRKKRKLDPFTRMLGNKKRNYPNS